MTLIKHMGVHVHRKAPFLQTVRAGLPQSEHCPSLLWHPAQSEGRVVSTQVITARDILSFGDKGGSPSFFKHTTMTIKTSPIEQVL